jgi:hypothetical protein
MAKSKQKQPTDYEKKQAIVTVINVLLSTLISLDSSKLDPCFKRLEHDLKQFIADWELKF